MIYVSFVSKNSPYETVINNYLLPSLKKFNLIYYIDYVENKGSWLANIQYKPQFLKNMLLKFKCPIISLDADAIIEKNPELFQTIQDYDFACHFLDWKMWYKKTYDRKELLGGTIYLNYNEKVLNFLDKWIAKQKENLQYPQKILEKLIKEEKELKIYELPLTYCFIECSRFPEIRQEVVISHHQKSRIYRKKLI